MKFVEEVENLQKENPRKNNRRLSKILWQKL